MISFHKMINEKIGLSFQTFPCVYSLMEGRTADDYVAVLHKVKEILQITPQTTISDFEKAERKALQTVFPTAKIIGCFFHYSQVIRSLHSLFTT